jgi:hypothetical protein
MSRALKNLVIGLCLGAGAVVVSGVLLPGQAAGQGGAAPSRDFLRTRLKFSEEQIRTITSGKPFCMEVETPDAAEVVLYGGVWVNADPVAFVKQYAEVEKLVDGRTFLAASRFSTPPVESDLARLELDAEDVEQLKDCRTGDCEVQLWKEAMPLFRRRVKWGTPDEQKQANRLMRRVALGALQAYQQGGNAALGMYHDKQKPTAVAESFRTLLSRGRDLPRAFPGFYEYLNRYPAGKPASTWDFYYWENVKFGLKPTFRINHVVVHQPKGSATEWLVANKQIYASHYFQTALDLWLCVRDPGRSKGYYLLTLKGSRQDGLTGVTGRLLRRVAMSKTKESMERALARLKERAEKGR